MVLWAKKTNNTQNNQVQLFHKKKTRCFSKAFHVPKRHPAAMVLSELCWEPHSNFFRENSPPPFTTLSTLLVVSFHKNMSNWLISAEFLPFWGVKNKKKIFYDHRMWPPSTSQKPGGLSWSEGPSKVIFKTGTWTWSRWWKKFMTDLSIIPKKCWKKAGITKLDFFMVAAFRST